MAVLNGKVDKERIDLQPLTQSSNQPITILLTKISPCDHHQPS